MADEFFGAFAAKVGNAPVAKVVATPPVVDDRQPVVADLIKDPVVTAEAAEEEVEVAAGTGFLGGPYVWGLLAMIVIVGAILLLR